MFIIENYGTAVLFCLVTMLCWGSWANTQKLAASSWRFELFYWDYVIGIFLTALLFALTLGSSGESGRGFVEDLRQAEAANVGLALLGGAVFNAANILLGAAISIAGMSVAFPVGIGLALVLGVLVNYADNPVGQPGGAVPGRGAGGGGHPAQRLCLPPHGRQRAGRFGQGLVLSVVAGVLMGFFYRYVAASMSRTSRRPRPAN
jgi:glucose uptake protein